DSTDMLGAAHFLAGNDADSFTHAILNPPYKKISADSATRRRLERVGLQATNAYTGFVAMCCELLTAGGQIVAITPRSFCNGPYFLDFRKFFLRRMTIDRIHLYGSRDQAFKEDEVLQENVIYRAVKGKARPDFVIISSSENPESERSFLN